MQTSTSAPDLLAGFRHRRDAGVRFGDLDAMGHLNNVALLRVLEVGRVDYMVDLGLAGHDELSYVLASLTCDFRAQAFYRDELVCGSRVTEFGRRSMILEQRVVRGETVVADARSVMVTLGPDRASSAPVPDRWRRAIAAWEEHGSDAPSREPR